MSSVPAVVSANSCLGAGLGPRPGLRGSRASSVSRTAGPASREPGDRPFPQPTCTGVQLTCATQSVDAELAWTDKTENAFLLGRSVHWGSPAFPSPSLGTLVADSGRGLTVQLPDPHPVLVGEAVVQRVAHRALVVGLHDGACGRHVAQPDGVAKLVDSHRKQVHLVGIWEHKEQWASGGTASRARPQGGQARAEARGTHGGGDVRGSLSWFVPRPSMGLQGLLGPELPPCKGPTGAVGSLRVPQAGTGSPQARVWTDSTAAPISGRISVPWATGLCPFAHLGPGGLFQGGWGSGSEGTSA